MKKAIKIRLYPTKEQKNVLNQHFGCCRFVYNNALNYKIVLYRDYKVKVSNKIINENQIISLETLNVVGMIKNHKLAKAIHDASWSTFVSMLNYKAEWYGREIRRISTFAPSSKTCSNCGWYNPNLTLSDRVFKCEKCGHEEDRDINASKNILNFSRDELTRINASGESKQ